MKPVAINLSESVTGAQIPLDQPAVATTRLSNLGYSSSGRKFLRLPLMEGSFSGRINRELKELEKTYTAAGKKVPTNLKSRFADGIQFLNKWYKEEVTPLADWQDRHTSADDVYEAILMGWKEARDHYNLGDGSFEKIKERLDSIRQEWAADPTYIFYFNPKTGDAIPQDEFERLKEDDPDAAAKVKMTSEIGYVHKIGNKYGFMSEKEHLAGVMAWWIVYGGGENEDGSTYGASNIGEARPSFGSIRWINAADTGGTAKPDKELATRERAAANAKKVARNRETLGTHVGEIPHTGQGHVMRDPGTGNTTGAPATRFGGSAGRGEFNTGQISGGASSGGAGDPPAKKFRRRPADEAIDRLAAALSEDVNDTWGTDSPFLTEDWQEEQAALERDARAMGEDDPASWMPSQLDDMPDYYASVVENSQIYLARDMGSLQAHPEAGTGEIVRADEVTQFVSDDDFIMTGGRIEIIDEDIYYDDFLTEEEAAAAAPAAGAAPPATGAAPPAAGAAPAQPGAAPADPAAAAQPNPEVDKAKQEGGKLLDQLIKQLAVLQKAPDWSTVKQDLVGKLKPYLG